MFHRSESISFPEVPEPRTKQKRRSHHTLQKQSSARPIIWKCGEKTLQRRLPFRFQVRLFAPSSKRPNEGVRLPLSGDLKLDNSSLQPDRDSMSPVLRIEFRQYVRDIAF